MNRTLPMVGIGRACLDEVRAHTAVGDAFVAVAPGGVVPACTSSMDPAGQNLLSASTGNELEEALAYVRRTLWIVTAPADEVHERRLTSVGVSIYPMM